VTGVETRRERTSGREKRAAESEGKKLVANFRPSRTTIVPDGGTADYSQGIFQLSKSLRRFFFLKRRIGKYDSNIYSILATKWLIIVAVSSTPTQFYLYSYLRNSIISNAFFATFFAAQSIFDINYMRR
jgi:hypothetical protein